MRTGRKNNMKNIKGNNKGYSIQELIVVIAIMAVLVGFLSMSVSILIGWDARECAEDIENHLNHVRTNALARLGAEMRITRDGTTDEYSVEYVEYNFRDDGSGNMIKASTVTKTDLIGKENVEIVCYFDDGTHVTISETENVTIGFSRTSGAFTEVKVNDITRVNVYCTSMEITRAGNTYAINMVPKTGKISMEKK
jgi:Tfp pilus assembly protein FimT